jgi:predicted kinase
VVRYHFWFVQSASDCSSPIICVTSLNMRKWMRDRLQRRKKKTPEQGNQAAPPPLQPAYFEEGADSGGNDSEASEAMESKADSQPAEEPAGEVAKESPAESALADAKRPRSRRRRGGRGRGGRGREQAVAQAFAPGGAVLGPDEPAEGTAAVGTEEAGTEEAKTGDEAAAAVEPKAPAVPAATPAKAARAPKGIVVLAIGLPGSGKSSWFKRHNVVPLSSDMVRSLLFDDVREQRYQDLVFSNLRSMLKARLIAKRPMNYVDATNLTPKEREHWVKLAKDYNYEVHAVFFDVPLETCIERHQRRDRVVPEDVMRRMAAKLKAPSFEEGFAKITVVRVKKKE